MDSKAFLDAFGMLIITNGSQMTDGDFGLGSLIDNSRNQAIPWLVVQGISQGVRDALMSQIYGPVFVVTGREVITMKSGAKFVRWKYTIRKIGTKEFLEALDQGQKDAESLIGQQMDEAQVHRLLDRTLWANCLQEGDSVQFKDIEDPHDRVDFQQAHMPVDKRKAILCKLMAIDSLCRERQVVEVLYSRTPGCPRIMTSMKSVVSPSEQSGHSIRNFIVAEMVVETIANDEKRRELDLQLTTVIKAGGVRLNQDWIYGRAWERIQDYLIFPSPEFRNINEGALNLSVRDALIYPGYPCENFSRETPNGLKMFINHLVRQQPS